MLDNDDLSALAAKIYCDLPNDVTISDELMEKARRMLDCTSEKVLPHNLAKAMIAFDKARAFMVVANTQSKL